MDGGHTFTVRFRRNNISKATKRLMRVLLDLLTPESTANPLPSYRLYCSQLQKEAYSHRLTAQDQTKPIQSKPNQTKPTTECFFFQLALNHSYGLLSSGYSAVINCVQYYREVSHVNLCRHGSHSRKCRLYAWFLWNVRKDSLNK